MNAFPHHFSFEFKTGLRNTTLLLMNYLFPLGFYAMMGLVMTQINPMFGDTILPSMAIFAIMAGTILGLPGPLVESREAGIFRSFKINGVPAISILTIPTLSSIFHTLIVSLIIALTAAPFFDGINPTNWLPFALIVILAGFTFGSIGALLGVVSNSSRSTVLLSQAIFLPSMLLGGLMMPLDVLPESVRFVSALMPTSYAMQAILGFAYGLETVLDPAVSVIVLAATGILAFGLSIFLFEWDSNNRTRRKQMFLAVLAIVPMIAGAFLA